MPFRIEHRPYALPFRAPVNTAHGPWGLREGVFVRVEAEDGRVGYGEVATIPWFGTETVEASLRMLETLGGLLRQEDLELLPGDCPCTQGALRAALEEAQGLGFARPEASAYLRVAALLPAGRLALEKVEERAELGFRTFKWKVGVGDAADEMAMLDDLLARLPSGAQLRLDANGAWDRRKAERWLAHCEGRPIEFVEQPVAAEARGAEDLLLGLAGDSPVPIALDESAVTDGQLRRWLGAGWPGFYIVKPCLLADPAARMDELAKARARVVFSSSLETVVGARRALRTAFAWTGEHRVLGFGVWPLFKDSRFDGPFAAPFVRAADLQALNPEAAWNATS